MAFDGWRSSDARIPLHDGERIRIAQRDIAQANGFRARGRAPRRILSGASGASAALHIAVDTRHSAFDRRHSDSPLRSDRISRNKGSLDSYLRLRVRGRISIQAVDTQSGRAQQARGRALE